MIRELLDTIVPQYLYKDGRCMRKPDLIKAYVHRAYLDQPKLIHRVLKSCAF